MRLNIRTIATVAITIFLIAPFNPCAKGAAKDSAGVTGDPAVASSAVSAAEPVGMPSDPMPEATKQTAVSYPGGRNMGVPRFELFAGYSYLRAVPTYADGNRLVWLNGGSTSLAFNLSRYLELVGDFGAYTNSEMRFTGGYTGTVNVDNSNLAVMTYLFGPRVSFRNRSRITPFAQALFGGVHANPVSLAGCTVNCTLLPAEDSFAMTAGGGLDLRLQHHFALRLIQAEYLMTRFANDNDGSTEIQNDIRLSSGVVFRFGGNPHQAELPPLTYSCFVNPASVYPGATIAVSGTAINLDPAKTALYAWSVDGGTVSGNSSTAIIDTTDAAPGTYTLKGHVSAGDKAGANADCTAPYIVKAYEPPTVSCTADPSVVIPGNSSAITATGMSPQSRPLTYSYSSTSGSVSGTSSTATLSTGGAPVGTVTVTCNVVDDKAQSASSTASVTIEAPVAAPKPTTSELCPAHFDRDPRRPARVDNEAKGCLDEVAQTLQRNSDANLAVVGSAASGEKDGKKLAVQRAANTKAYLVGERGIDSSRITVYAGSQNGKIVSIILIPPDATFDATGDTPAQ